ncbi:unnamed protein product, partial [Iphiclides podalirius]
MRIGIFNVPCPTVKLALYFEERSGNVNEQESADPGSVGPPPPPPCGGVATSSSLHLRAADSRTTNGRPPRAGERFYIRVEFAVPNRYKSKYRVVGRSTRSSCSRPVCNRLSFRNVGGASPHTHGLLASRHHVSPGKCAALQCLHK